MSKFSKKPVFGPFWEKIFSQKIRLCHAQLHMGFLAKFQKKLMVQFQGNAWAEGRTKSRKDGQTLFYRTLSATAWDPKIR